MGRMRTIHLEVECPSGTMPIEALAEVTVARVTALVKGFGCRPGASDRPGIGAGVRKPPKNESAGQR